MRWAGATLAALLAAPFVFMAYAAGGNYLSSRCHLGSASEWCVDAVPAFWMGTGIACAILGLGLWSVRR